MFFRTSSDTFNMDIDVNAFYERTKDLLKENKKSLDDLMSIKNLSFNAKSTYFSMRQAGNLPRADDVLRIAEFFGVSIEYLLSGKQPANQEKIDKIKDALLGVVRDLDDIKT